MFDDLHFDFSDLEILSESQKRKEYHCGCYHKRSPRAEVWSFLPVCEKHKAEAAKRFKALSWKKKAVSYMFFGFLILMCIAALFIVYSLLRAIIG